MFRFYKLSLIIALLLGTSQLSAQTQRSSESPISRPNIGIKTNVLYGATGTINLGAEFRLSNSLSMDVSGNYNGWTYGDNRKIKHILAQPELRYWWFNPFHGSFIGVHAHYAYYNVGSIGLPFGAAPLLKTNRFEGWLAGAGISYGHTWYLAPHWSLEATLGVGYAYMNYDRYECATCGRFIKNETFHYVGPTKVGVSFIYIIK